jgi:hypothetical protein
VFGKQDNTDVINLSAIAAGTGGSPLLMKQLLRLIHYSQHLYK